MKYLLTTILFLIPLQSQALSCKKAKKYYKYDRCIVETRYFHAHKSSKKYAKYKKFRKKYEKCYPLGREDLLWELRTKYNINIYE